MLLRRRNGRETLERPPPRWRLLCSDMLRRLPRDRYPSPARASTLPDSALNAVAAREGPRAATSSILRSFLPRESRIELQQPVLTVLPTVKFTGLKINLLCGRLAIQGSSQFVLSLRQRRQYQHRRATRSSSITSTRSRTRTRRRVRLLHCLWERVRRHLESSNNFILAPPCRTVCDIRHVPHSFRASLIPWRPNPYP